MDEVERNLTPPAEALRSVLSAEPMTAIDAFGLVRAEGHVFQMSELQNALFLLERCGMALIDENLRVRVASAEFAHVRH